MTRCNICGNENTKKMYSDHVGYIENDVYDIYGCDSCDAQFVSPLKVDPKLYDIIYSDRTNEIGPAGYGQHLIQAKKISNHDKPLEFLIETDINYSVVGDYLKDKKNLDILEVGAGYGYLTYALKKLNHNSFGIDISRVTIDYALQTFGPNYKCADLESFIGSIGNNRKFDLIIAIELVEHLSNPEKFIKNCFSILKPNGRVLITTPNKGYYRKGSIWISDLPPVHLFWLSPKTFNYIAEENGLNLKYFDLASHILKHDKINLLINYLRSREKIRIRPHVFKASGELNLENHNSLNQPSLLKKLVRFILVDIAPIRILSNFLYRKIINPKFPNTSTQALLLWRG